MANKTSVVVVVVAVVVVVVVIVVVVIVVFVVANCNAYARLLPHTRVCTLSLVLCPLHSRFLMRKITAELEELLLSKLAGRVILDLTVCELLQLQ